MRRSPRRARASASTLAVDAGGTIRFTAARGEANDVNATDVGVGSPSTMAVTDTGSRINVGSGCVAVTSHEARCPYQPGQDLVVDLGDRADTARAFTIGPLDRVRVTGGTGDDTIEDSPQFGAEVSGGTGDDKILVHPNLGGSVDVHGDWGDDSITAISAVRRRERRCGRRRDHPDRLRRPRPAGAHRPTVASATTASPPTEAPP